jgi:hypothetical protein
MAHEHVWMRWGAGTLVLSLAGCSSDDGETGGAESTDATAESSSSGTRGEPSTDASTGTGSGSGGPADTSAGDDVSTMGEGTGMSGDPGPDLREAGPYAIELDTGTAMLPGCSMGYDLRAPAGVPDAPVVVLAHGFQSNRQSMAGWAEHWASWGLRVVTPNLCHATIIDSDHAQNGEDLRALVVELALPSPIYAGYSAGGLASVLAASADPGATALVGLDMVDSEGLGAGVAASVGVPAFDIVGEPSMCNTTNNGLAVFAAMPEARALRVTEADHCDFQNPADALCGITCTGSNDQFDDSAIQTAVLGLSTAAVLWQTGVEPTGAQWWTPGQHYYELLVGLGILQEP